MTQANLKLIAAGLVLAIAGAVLVYANLDSNLSLIHWRGVLCGVGVVVLGAWSVAGGAVEFWKILPPTDDASRSLTEDAAVWVKAAATAKRSGNQAALDAAVVGLSATLKGGGK